MAKQYKTKGKEILYAFFQALGGKRFCAKDIIDYLEAKELSMNQATVYRNLEKLCADGILIKSKQPNDEHCYYQYVGENSHCQEHLHLQCKKCGKIIHLENPGMNIFFQEVQQKYGFLLEPMESVLVGVCAECNQ